jgi:hypothetical protein
MDSIEDREHYQVRDVHTLSRGCDDKRNRVWADVSLVVYRYNAKRRHWRKTRIGI